MKIIKGIAILSLILIMLTSCSFPNNNTNTDETKASVPDDKKSDDVIDKGPVKGGTLKLFCTVPDTLNPILTTNRFVCEIESLIFESMVNLDKSQKPEPSLSDEWNVSADGLMWNFHIRDNVFWQDGQPLTSEDVEFTVGLLLKNNLNSIYKRNVENIASFSAVDKNNFKIILKKADSFTAEQMTFPILPKHYYSGEDILKTAKNMNPIGTGPYKFQDYMDKKNIILAANTNWWNKGLQTGDKLQSPFIDNISVNIYNDGNEQMNAFQTRGIDVASLGPEESSRYSGRTDMTIKKFTGKDYEFISFNLSKPLLQDLAIRQAIANTVDKIRIVNELLPGEAVAADVPVIPDTWFYDTNIVSITPNIKLAKEILAKDGWKEDNGVIYKNINGIMTPLNLELMVNEDNETRVRIAEKLSEQLKDIGINLTINKVDWNEEQKLINTHKYDMAILGWNTSSIPDLSFAYSTNEIATGRNISGYSNKDVDKYLQEIISENDANKKKTLFISMKELINNDVPYIGLFFYDNAIIYNNRVRGEMNPYVWNQLSNITKWYLPDN